MFVVVSVPAEEPDKVGGNSSCEESMPDRKLSLYCGAAAPGAQLDLRGPGCVVVGVLPCAWIVQLTLPMWIGVCTSTAHDFAHSNPAK